MHVMEFPPYQVPQAQVRQISMHKWMNGVFTLQAFPSQKECWIESHWSGYVFTVERISTTKFLCKTYLKGSLVHTSPLVVSEQHVPVVNANVGNLMNQEESRIAYSRMLEAFLRQNGKQ